MPNNLRSEYEIDLKIQDDTKEVIRNLESGLSRIGKAAKDSIKSGDLAGGFKDAEKAANEMIDKLNQLSKDSDKDFNAIIKSYSRSSQKAIGELEKQYVAIKDAQKEIIDQENKLNHLKALKADHSVLIEENVKLLQLYEKNKISSIKELDAMIKKNRQIRTNLKMAEAEAKHKATTDKAEKKSLDEKLKHQKAYAKAIELAEKTTKALTNQTSKLGKAWQFTLNIAGKIGKVTQFAADASGLIGGIGRTVTSGLNMVSQASDKALERERAANRIKGMSAEDADTLLGEVYVRTGADYSTIVDAINRVRSVLGNVGKDDISQAAAIEVRYPGMSLAFASSNTAANMQNVNTYANRMKAIQKASGASDEQIQSSTHIFANMRPENFNSAKITELQAVYLGLQNSGAFESQDELDRAFRSFARKQRDSGEDVFKLANEFNWTNAIHGRRNKLQAQNTLQNMDWSSLGLAAKTTDTEYPIQTTAEKNAERMRNLEERRNKMMIKLVDILEPIVDALFEALDNEKTKKLIDGIIKFVTEAVPVIADVIVKIAEGLGVIVSKAEKVMDDFVEANTRASENTTGGMIGPKYASGGLALMPSIVGERGPEAIIPLDFARSQRAANIATNITQTFNMGTSQTTALSLAQAVKSRDFTRAMSENAFISRRCGVF